MGFNRFVSPTQAGTVVLLTQECLPSRYHYVDTKVICHPFETRVLISVTLIQSRL